MTAFNIVRFRVKPGMEDAFVESHRTLQPAFEGFLGGSLIRTGEQTFCLIGEWQGFPSIVAARPQTIELLDSMRNMLEDLGGGLGVTDTVSGDAVVKLAGPKPRKRVTARRTGKKVAGKTAKKTSKSAKKTAKAASAKRKPAAGKSARRATAGKARRQR